ncbi:MAG: flagellar biosynthetic protein FliQ [Sulfitobacter sp.]
MNDIDFSSTLVQFMLNAALLGGVPLAAATLVGLTVSIFQAITQVQDQTLSQTFKITVISLILLSFGGALAGPLMNSTIEVFEGFPSVSDR